MSDVGLSDGETGLPGRLTAIARDLRKAIAADAQTRRALARAIWELALARRRMAARPVKELLASAQGRDAGDKPEEAVPQIDPASRATISRVAYAIPIMGLRVPWRSDCLVQALAAQRWLEREGIATSLRIGVRSDGQDGFGAHAWLLAGDQLVTGGEISSYETLI